MLQGASAMSSKFAEKMMDASIPSVGKIDVPLNEESVSYICINNSGFIWK
jgi:hypothetical protein